MSEVKTYAVNCNDAWLNTEGDDISDSYVKYADYLELAVQLANAESKCRELAAENAHARERHVFIRALAVSILEHSGGRMDWRGAMEDATELLQTVDSVYAKTPATDAFLAEVRAQARNEGINYAAGRLAAAFNHGFVDKPLTEVCDVVRMIMDTKEELANSTLPAADGISGEYAEKFLEEFAAQLRKGAAL